MDGSHIIYLSVALWSFCCCLFSLLNHSLSSIPQGSLVYYLFTYNMIKSSLDSWIVLLYLQKSYRFSMNFNAHLLFNKFILNNIYFGGLFKASKPIFLRSPQTHKLNLYFKSTMFFLDFILLSLFASY